MVAGYAVGGGHVLHVICDLTIAADNARFGQTGPKVGSFDGGFGAGCSPARSGQKKAKEIWFLCRQYDAEEALRHGPRQHGGPARASSRRRPSQWCREMLALSPFALRLLKASFHAAEDGLAGIQQLAHDANLLFYCAEEAQEGRDATARSDAGVRAVPQAPVNGEPLRWRVGPAAHAARRPSCPCWWAPPAPPARCRAG